MNWEAVGAVGEILGAVAVIATLFYLARQIDETRREIQSSSVISLHSVINDAFTPIYNNEMNMSIWVSGLNDPESLTDKEREIFYLFMTRVIGPVTAAEIQNRKGTLDDEALELYSILPKQFLQSPGGKAWRADSPFIFNPRLTELLLNENT